MADWKFLENYSLHNNNQDLMISHCKPKFGDAFSPVVSPLTIPTQVVSVNWCVSGTIKWYSADMTFIAEYGAGVKMGVPDPSHVAMGQVVLVASSDDVEYYCLRGLKQFYTGDIINLKPNQEVEIPLIPSSGLFVSEGSIITSSKEHNKGALLNNLAQKTSLTFKGGEAGAMVASFNNL
tara:strand:- start:5565 stop:6101 length:537 start_codon:yes stop_codon:yes gene_type:complete